MLRTATEPMTLGIQHSLSNHDGKGVERVGEARPYRWRLVDHPLNEPTFGR